MAILLLKHPIAFPATLLGKALASCFPMIGWRVGEGEDEPGFDRPQTIIGRCEDEMILCCIELKRAAYRPANGSTPPAHICHATISRPSTDDGALAVAIALVVGVTLAVDQDASAQLQLAPGENWLDGADMRRLMASLDEDPALTLRHHYGLPERTANTNEPARQPDTTPAAVAPADAPSQKKQRQQLGSFTLLLDGDVHIEWKRIDEAMNVIDPGGNWTTVATPGGMGFVNGRSRMMLIWSPIPYDLPSIEQVYARSFWFDGDRGRVARHRQYITIMIDAPDDFEAKRGTALAATIMLGLINQLPQVAAVFNNMVSTLFSPQMTHGQVGILHTGEIPIQLWTWVAPNSLVDGDISVTTGGLQPFLGYEVEVWNAPHTRQFVLEKLNGVLRYLLINGPVVTHGDTIGTGSGDRSTRCFFGPSRADRPAPVPAMFLEFDIEQAAQPKRDLPVPPPTPQPSAAPTFGRRATFGRKGL